MIALSNGPRDMVQTTSKVAAYQAPLLPVGSMHGLELIGARVAWCERNDVAFLCCPEGVLGGLADYATPPIEFAINVAGGELHAILAPIASEAVTTIVGFTEIGENGLLYTPPPFFTAATCSAHIESSNLQFGSPFTQPAGMRLCSPLAH